MTTIHVKSENYWCNLDHSSVELLRVALIMLKSKLQLAMLPFSALLHAGGTFFILFCPFFTFQRIEFLGGTLYKCCLKVPMCV